MSVSGYKNHARTGGWNAGTITQTDKVFTVTHDRDIEFLVDKADVDETARTAAIEKAIKDAMPAHKPSGLTTSTSSGDKKLKYSFEKFK